MYQSELQKRWNVRVFGNDEVVESKMVTYTMKMQLRHVESFRYPKCDNQLYKVVKFFFMRRYSSKMRKSIPAISVGTLAQAYPKLLFNYCVLKWCI